MQDNKSVVFVTGSLAGGGAEKVMSILASGCADMGASVTLVVLRGGKKVYPVSEKVNIIQFKNCGKFSAIIRVVKLHKVLKSTNTDAVIPFLPIISLYTLLANIGVGKKIIMSERADPNAKFNNLKWKDRIGNFFMRKVGLYRKADWMVFQTPDAQQYYNKKIQAKSSIISNPLDTSKLPLLFEGQREKRIVAAGRFSEEKNFEMLIEGFSEFYKIHQDYSLSIYGDGPLRKEYEQIIVENGVQDCVDMPGFSANLVNEINKASAYVSTSNHEGISNSMIEALGMGIPTIVTDCPVGGARLFVKNEINGFLIQMNDKNALVDALCKVVEDKELSKNISQNASELRFKIDKESICKKWLEII